MLPVPFDGEDLKTGLFVRKQLRRWEITASDASADLGVAAHSWCFQKLIGFKHWVYPVGSPIF